MEMTRENMMNEYNRFKIKQLLNKARWSVTCQRLASYCEENGVDLCEIELHQTTDYKWAQRCNRDRIKAENIGIAYSMGPKNYSYLFVYIKTNSGTLELIKHHDISREHARYAWHACCDGAWLDRNFPGIGEIDPWDGEHNNLRKEIELQAIEAAKAIL